MIISKFINIKTSKKFLRFFQDKISKDIKLGNIINIPVQLLSKESKYKVKVKCDICGREKEIPYRTYTKNISKYNIYACSHKCSQIKYKKTCLEKFGVEFPSQSNEIKEKTKKTYLEKYGVENISQHKEIKEKKKKTFFKNYGVNHPLKSKKIKDKIKKTNLERYGVESLFNLKEFREKIDFIIKEKYGVDNISQNNDIKEKKKKTFLERYGVDEIFKSKEIQDKIKKTNLERYGAENVFQNKEILKIIIKKGIETKIKKGIYKSDNELTQFKLYYKKVRQCTEKSKKELFDKWDGYDYYDGEYIKDNFVLKFYDNNYPTIDHKISILYGFLNNLLPEAIGNINNLCITKRKINITKNKKTEKEFNEILKNI